MGEKYEKRYRNRCLIMQVRPTDRISPERVPEHGVGVGSRTLDGMSVTRKTLHVEEPDFVQTDISICLPRSTQACRRTGERLLAMSTAPGRIGVSVRERERTHPDI